MDAPSLKKSIIIAMSTVPEVEGLENNDVILITSAGNICGKLIPVEEIENKTSYNAVFANLCNQVKEDYLKENPSAKSSLSGNDGYLILTDVKIKSTSSNTTTQLPFLVVFYDQIIGVSVGSID